MTEGSPPVVATLKRLETFIDQPSAVGEADTPEWFPASDLMNADNQRLEQALIKQAKHYPKMDKRTRGSYFIGEYSWYLPAVAIGAYLVERRAPNIALDNVLLRYSTFTWHNGEESGEAERLDVRLLHGQFACLPDDPDADHPDALVMPDEPSLLNWLRTMLESHLTLLIERVYEQTRLSHHAQWCLVADACAAQFLNLGKKIGDEARGKSAGMAFIKADNSPMNNPKTSYISLQYLDHIETFRARGGCCRYYTVSETKKSYCSTCVLRKPEDRDALLLAYMQRKYEEAAS